MNARETMKELSSLGSDSVAAIYRRHGAKDAFGVKFGDLANLRKKIGKNSALAASLWKTGNVDARSLATRIVDAKELGADELHAWAESTALR